nr:hypothetical protein [Tanacetum cinerariifolium]
MIVGQGHTQEEGIDYDKVFAPVARIEAIRLFLACASFIGFTVYQMDVKSSFLYGTIDEELCRESEALMHEKFQISDMGELNFFLGLQVLQKEDVIFLSQDKYVGDILKKFRYSDVRPDIMFAVCACARHQVTPKECHLHEVKRIFRYLKGHPKLGFGILNNLLLTCRQLWPLQQLRQNMLQLAAASCCRQVLWIQNQLLDYGYNFMNTKIYIDNNNAICIVKNPVYHSKTKHIEIKHHFIRDCFEKKLISVDHIHTDENVADLLTKPFDAERFRLSMPCEALSREFSTSIL